ncbi:unnamed protein product [Heligmosomoides polygyrus]|uniref:Secreted protein n=1 Tax=Heligmosomoides polygyrus TaxID=6339 RepID=A0A183FHK1_HELPZ|nr:unnamed protein product [Heligmosomoides polygyrus]
MLSHQACIQFHSKALLVVLFSCGVSLTTCEDSRARSARGTGNEASGHACATLPLTGLRRGDVTSPLEGQLVVDELLGACTSAWNDGD